MTECKKFNWSILGVGTVISAAAVVTSIQFANAQKANVEKASLSKPSSIISKNNSDKAAKFASSLFARTNKNFDFLEMKLAVDGFIDPNFNADKVRTEINQMITDIKAMLPYFATSMEKMHTIRKYLYKSGEWNKNRPFSYDLKDPLGKLVKNKLLHDYLSDRKGNCITMPALFIILGQKLGIKVTASTAPLHVFVKFTDDATGKTYNLETTSGAGGTRDLWYRKMLKMTDKSIYSGVYMQTLSNQETTAVFAATVIDNYMIKRQYKHAIAVSDEILKHYPKFVYVIVKKGTAFYYLLQRDIISKYPTARSLPPHKVEYAKYLSRNNRRAFTQADQLGWVPLKSR